jgi:hypothetical protein
MMAIVQMGLYLRAVAGGMVIAIAITLLVLRKFGR